MKIQQKKKKI